MGSESCTRAGEGSAKRTKRGILSLMVQPEVVSGALRVSMLVGTVLNVVNNGERLWSQQPVSLWQVAMNYLVPFCVSSYSAARIEAARSRDE